MSTDINTSKLNINILSQTQYDSIENPSNEELYFVESLSKYVSKITGTTTEATQNLSLNIKLENADQILYVNIDNKLLLPSEYTITTDNSVINLTTEVPSNTKWCVAYLSVFDLEAGPNSSISTINGQASSTLTQISLGTTLQDVNQIVLLNVNGEIILPTNYSLSSDGQNLILTNPIQTGQNYSIKYIKNFNLDSLPVATKTELGTVLPSYGLELNQGKLGLNISNTFFLKKKIINLELNSEGILTLKAGSLIYLADGNFTPYTITEDISNNHITSTIPGNAIVIFNQTDNNLQIIPVTSINSGTTADMQGSSTATINWWYNSENNRIYWYDGSTWSIYPRSYPIACVSSNGSKVISILSTFDGFGFMGRTFFKTPQVIGIGPNGYNEDGSLKYKVYDKDTFLIYTYPSAAILGFNIQYFIWDENDACAITTFSEIKDIPSVSIDITWLLSKSDNKLYVLGNNSYSNGSDVQRYIGASFYFNSAVAMAMYQPRIFEPLNRDNIPNIIRQGKPSSSTIFPLSTGPSGTVYTAPGNGYFYAFSNSASAANQALHLESLVLGSNNPNITSISISPFANSFISVIVPVKQGDRVAFYYSVPSVTFNFIFDEGAA